MPASVKPTLSQYAKLSVLDRAHLCEVLWKMEEAERLAREEETGVGLPPLSRLPFGSPAMMSPSVSPPPTVPSRDSASAAH